MISGEEQIRNKAWFEALSKELGTTQLTHALSKLCAMRKAMDIAADWIEQCPFENALFHAEHLRNLLQNNK